MLANFLTFFFLFTRKLLCFDFVERRNIKASAFTCLVSSSCSLPWSLVADFILRKNMSSTASELSPSKVWVKDALQSFLPLSSASILQSRQPSHQNPSALVAFLENEKFLNPRYKTEICRNFKERSKCIYGDKCQFAHGRRELRDVIRNTKYKTKLCQKYWLVGYCAYGPRCNFLHYELETDEDFDTLDTLTIDNDANGSIHSSL